MSEYQEEVLTGLLDLQAELRGDEPEPHDEPAASASSEASVEGDGEGADAGDDARNQDTLAVTEGGVTVSLSPGSDSPGSVSSGSLSSGSLSSGASTKGLGVNERLAALNERLAQLEYDLAGVTKRIERIEPDPEVESSGDTDPDVDARWRSFLDLQKIVADRLDQR
jgi:hypothetical protein